MDVIPAEVLEAVGKSFTQGDSFRMHHKYRSNGTVCTTPDKDPAMTVTRVSNAWVFHCHRCHISGSISDNRLAPGSTRKKLKALRALPIHEDSAKITLPHDFDQMTERGEEADIPWDAYHWMWRFGITSKEFLKFHIGYSQLYQRVIIPLYEYAEVGNDTARKLVGWIGRNTLHTKSSKEPKYITRAQKGKRRFFIAPGVPGTVVICEDCISAIKISMATGYMAVALLNTSVSDDLMRQMRGRKIFLWLDGDMLAHSVKTVQRMRQLGLNAKHIHTPKDPKEYNTLFIKDSLRNGGV